MIIIVDLLMENQPQRKLFYLNEASAPNNMMYVVTKNTVISKIVALFMEFPVRV